MTREQASKAERLFYHYLDAVAIYLKAGMGHLPGTLEATDTPSQENFRRCLEELMCVSEQSADDFRRSVYAYFSRFRQLNKSFCWTTNPKIADGICKFLMIDPMSIKPFVGKYRTIDDPWEPSP